MIYVQMLIRALGGWWRDCRELHERRANDKLRARLRLEYEARYDEDRGDDFDRAWSEACVTIKQGGHGGPRSWGWPFK